MTKNMTKKKQLIEAVKNIPIIAQKERWELTLDKEEGSLFYSPKVIPAGAQLHQVTDEYAVYLDKNNQPKGIMIEYYGINFIKHHKLFKKLSTAVFTGDKKIKVAGKNRDKNKEDVTVFKALLETTIIKEAGAKMVGV
jgi:hypothetical protein